MTDLFHDAPFRNPRVSVEARVADVLARMTLEELAWQVVQVAAGRPALPVHQEWAAKGVGSVLFVGGAELAALQATAAKTRLGIPLLAGIDAIHGHTLWAGATVYPTQLGLAAGWDTDAVKAVGRATAIEMVSTGLHWTFSPTLCRPRDLRWGRTGETFGEDQLLIAEMGAAMIAGYQGDRLDAPTSVAACPKHFIAYGDTVGGRDASECELSERTIRARYLKPFQAAVDAGAQTIMCAYQTVDGVAMSENHRWLTEILKGELRFEGLVVTDWECATRMVQQVKSAEDLDRAVVRCLKGGTDLFMAEPEAPAAILRQLAAGTLTRGDLERAAGRVLAVKFRLGLFERPLVVGKPEDVLQASAHRDLAHRTALGALTLVRNRDQLLPLEPRARRRIALIGPYGDDPVVQAGDWNLGYKANQDLHRNRAHPRANSSTIRDGLERRLAAEGAVITYTRGCGGVPMVPAHHHVPERRAQVTDDPAGEAHPERLAAAVRAAEAADLVVLVVGDPPDWDGEFCSTAHLRLPENQQRLYEAVRATGTPLVVILLCSKPLAIPEIADGAEALLVAFRPGQATGDAVAAVLCGDAEPLGRLPITFPRHVGQLPVAYDFHPASHGKVYVDDATLGYDRPLFAFGEGLGYERLRLVQPTLRHQSLPADTDQTVTLTVENPGIRTSSTVVQVYARLPVGPVSRPNRWLAAWARVTVEPGQRQAITIPIPRSRLAICDADGAWRLPPGAIEVLVGTSSRDQDLTVLKGTVAE